MSKFLPFEKIGIVGAGSMGSEMALLFAEHGLTVSSFDVAGQNIDNLKKYAESAPEDVRSRISTYKDYDPFISSLGGKDTRKLFVFSIKHGSPADQVLESMDKYLTKGDIILDGGNEWYLNTERRQKELGKRGVHYIGMGVSGGYQSARRGPSMSPGGNPDAVKEVLPILEKFAAKDKKTGAPCVTAIGPGGSGHYVKMVHNGIEQGMLGIMAESWELLYKCLAIPLDEISAVYRKWAEQGELARNFLVEIGSDICGQSDEYTHSASHLLNKIQDKVVQDADDSEGTGFWTIVEAANRHVSAPTIAAAHFLRVASSDRAQRLQVVEALGQDLGAARKQQISDDEKKAFVEDLRLAVYCATLASFAQGMNLIARASDDEEWNVDLSKCIQIWREGCIIRSEYIADLLQPLYEKEPAVRNTLTLGPVADEIKRTFPALQRVVKRALEWNAHIPSISASLEYFKYCAGLHLPTQFMEAELDYFGAHSFDLKEEGPGDVKKGKHHFEWKPA
ncbi:6-phosphogluconate dehydrogenase, decarboxylating [Gloeophyllum trabeum ATCC 11539]|uniref:6-phosphogluconate dehydrogenase, decarboxylating n=1 Tax=Gloeophyllum trabeum (strain ATCC 11539 / FP-39264 / Madison 617) TaxID=670483 RepID=S7RNJ5_GLOTA|nr:6-phosphogluconate dehydrogenase, decarboxylating [Gloeophyllum trabeum ATCC 11539]EPQ54339.1 6-phosphogluconate dehydrogenase, decarboxylating [Gloeophyllum trabeum ATCC 11539]